jgi:BON domain
MDHRWDEASRQEHATREERERFATSRIERDLDVERRDQLCLADRMRLVNQSPWEIGAAWYDQRDTYTRNSEIDASGYGRGPNFHPEEGSYAYPREFRSENGVDIDVSDASLYEKEAWPWLVYKDPEEDPYFAFLHEGEQSLWSRVKDFVARTFHVGVDSKAVQRSDERIKADAYDALWHRGDLDPTDIEVQVKASHVTLEGTVADRRSKRVAEDVAKGVLGVRGVENRLQIRHDDTSDADVVFAPPTAALSF